MLENIREWLYLRLMGLVPLRWRERVDRWYEQRYYGELDSRLRNLGDTLSETPGLPAERRDENLQKFWRRIDDQDKDSL